MTSLLYLKRPGTTFSTLKPLFIKCPDLQQHILEKAKDLHTDEIRQLQHLLIQLHMKEIPSSSLKILQDQRSELLKIRIAIGYTRLDNKTIIKLFNCGLVCELHFAHIDTLDPKFLQECGERFLLTVGNIMIDGPISCFINSTVPSSQGFSETPTKHKISIYELAFSIPFISSSTTS